jgi:hypothetical protein
LKHPSDGLQWRKVDNTFPEFAKDARNVRFRVSRATAITLGL